MNAALKDIIKQRGHEQREIDDAKAQIDRLKDRITHLYECIEKKEHLVNDYDAIINHSREFLSKTITESIPQNEEEQHA